MIKVLVFEVWGDYAHFRRFYTTTSPLSFPFPPRSAICGLIGAIIGLEKDNNAYLDYLSTEKAQIALRLINPLKKIIIAENLIDTKTAMGPGMNLIKNRTQIRFEFLKNQRYRIYFSPKNGTDEIYQKLKDYLEKHFCFYTPCLGLSENIANFEFKGEYTCNVFSDNNGYVPIDSVLPMHKISETSGVWFESDGEYFTVRMPLELNRERVVKKYGDFIFDRNCKPIKAKLIDPFVTIDYPDGRKENIVFIE